MSSTYRTLDGDMLDAICKAKLGSEQHVAAVLDANPGLAARGPVYPAGLLIFRPDVSQPTVTGQIKLWGQT